MLADQLVVIIESLEKVGMAELLFRYLFEFLIILAEHDDIDIVVPGDKAVMAHSTQEGSAVRKITQAVFFAYCIKQVEHVQFHCPDFLHLCGDRVTAAHFLFQKILRYFNL